METQAKKGDKLCSSDETEEAFEGGPSKPRNGYKTKWEYSQDAADWIHLAKAQEKGLKFWQTRSHAIIVHDSMPVDCIEKVVSENREKTLYQRLSTPRPAPKIMLKSVWNLQQQQQQQQQHDICGSSGRLVRGSDTQAIAAVTTKGAQGHLLRMKRIYFKVISEFKEFQKMQYVKTKKECSKFKKWLTSTELDIKPNQSSTIWERKERPTCSAKHQDAHELGSIELYELGGISKTVQCPTCLRFKRRNHFLHMWCTSYAVARTDQKIQKSVRDHVKSILFCDKR